MSNWLCCRQPPPRGTAIARLLQNDIDTNDAHVAGQYSSESNHLQAGRQLARLILAVPGQCNVSETGMLSRRRPFGLPVSHQIELQRAAHYAAAAGIHRAIAAKAVVGCSVSAARRPGYTAPVFPSSDRESPSLSNFPPIRHCRWSKS